MSHEKLTNTEYVNFYSNILQYRQSFHGSDGPAGRVRTGRVGSGRVTILPDFGGSALLILKFFTDYFLVPESIWIFEYYIRID